MKKRILAILMLCTILCASIVGFAGCDGVVVDPNDDGSITITPNPTPNPSNPGQTHVHVWTDERVITQADCTTDGVKILTCACGEEEVVTIPALGHDRLRIYAKAPTCEEVGWDTYEKCLREGCGYTTYEEIKALGHDNASYQGKKATCTEFGWDAYTICGRCHFSTYNKIDALGHNYVDGVCDECKLTNPDHEHVWNNGTTTLEATCTTSGVMKYTCTVGDCKETKTEEVGALGHDSVRYNAKYPTCEEIGWNAYEVCNRCDHNTYVELPAAGHSFDSGKITTDATCEQDGVKTYTRFCYETKTETIPAIGHAYGSWTTSIEATCEENGQEKCVCANDSTHVKTRATQSIGHSYGAWIVSTPASCEENGQEKRICANDSAHVQTRSISATGHTEVVDQAVAPTYTATGLTEGSHCSTCKKVLIKQEMVPILQAQYHSITYRNIKTAEYPSITSYAEHLGLLDLPQVSVDGYNFLGWYTASVGGDVVDYIDEGSTKNYVLFAHWETIDYTITYKDAPITNNVATYTVEDEIVLNDPEWSGLSFAYWKDEDGNEKEIIEKGSTGNITLTAHWRYKQELAVPNEKERDYITLYDESTDRYHFIYELGVIDDIVLETITSSKKDYGQELSWSRETTITMEKSIADTASQSIGTNITKTEEYSNTIEWAGSESTTEGWSNTISLEINFADIVKPKLEGTQSGSTTNETSWGHSTTTGGSTSSGSQIENAYSSTVSYVEGSSKSISETRTIPANMPTGTYTYAYVGTATVYSIITYDAKTKDYYVDIYSILENNYNTTVLYEMSYEGEQKINIVENKPLNVKVPVDEIEEYIDSSWYKVQYDANGGSGTMPTSMFFTGLEHSLYENQFTRTGYTFIGWKVKGGDTEYKDKAKVTDLAEKGQMIVLEAQWSLNTYTITCMWNDGTSAVHRTVTYTVKQVMLIIPGPSRVRYTFGGWYRDVACTIPADLAQLLKSPKDIVLYAKWDSDEYTVTFDANGGSVSQSTKIVWYNPAGDITYGVLPTPTRTDYAFVGWKLGSTTITSSTVVTTAGNHTLVAEWTRKQNNFTLNSSNGYGDVTVTDKNHHYDIIYTRLNVAKLKSLGYVAIDISVGIDIYADYTGGQIVEMYNYKGGTCYYSQKFDCSLEDWETHYIGCQINLSSLVVDANGEATIVMKYYAGKAYDDWTRGTTYWSIVAVK